MLTTEKRNALSQILGYEFHNPTHLTTALTHSSFIHESALPSHQSSERLEFLGDSVLSLLATEILMERYSLLPEGQLSKMRSMVVNEEVLAQLARLAGLAGFMFLGRGEQKTIHERDAILADAFEAILGAAYLDGGLAASRQIYQHLLKLSEKDLFGQENLMEFDAKSRLQEFCLKTWQELPSYEAQEIPGGFKVTLKVHGKEVLTTQNISKKKAELYLAKACLAQELHLKIGETTYAS